MGINIRTKGQTGEREVAAMLNAVVQKVRGERGLPALEDRDLPFQRNQNQSAVGGDDLSNPFKLAIEVKRQEALSINAWWRQCVASANRSEGKPILIYRQNRKPWRVVMLAPIPVSDSKAIGPIQVEMDADSFLAWFAEYYRTNF